MKIQRLCFWLILICSLQACSHEADTSQTHLLTVKATPFTTTLFYSGIIAPLNTTVIPCPVEGVVIDRPFQYGETVNKNQLLFVLSSTKFLADYKTALMQYIKTKNDFNNSKAQLIEAKFLHKNQLISDDDYKNKQSNYFAAQLTLMQAKDVLDNLLQQLNVKNINLNRLSITDIDKVMAAMHLSMNSENIQILAPAKGVVLSLTKGEEDNKKILQGSMVKQGDVLAVIGDMNGMSIEIKVNELTVNQIKLGHPVKITGVAFPDDKLQGKVIRVDKQGEISNGGAPTFTVAIAVDHLTTAEQQEIHVGMSAKIEIDFAEKPQIMLPIVAIKEKNGVSYVEVYQGKNKAPREVRVETGKTTLDSVAILSGLTVGDKIVLSSHDTL